MPEALDQFAGFQNGPYSTLHLPPMFMEDLFPRISDLAELKLVLFCFWALPQKEGRFPYLTYEDFTHHPALMQGMAVINPDTAPESLLTTALERAIKHQILLCVEVTLPQGRHTLYFVNTEKGRDAVEQIHRGDWQPGDFRQPVEILPERPNIYKLYEANFGPLTPMISDALKDIAQEYPGAWIDEAMREAVQNNKRSLKYVQAILKRWQQEGKTGHETPRGHDPTDPEDNKRFIRGKYADIIDH